MASRKRTIHDRVKRAERAWNDLGLSLVTKADKERWWRIWDGLIALDEEQSKLKAAIGLLIEQNADRVEVTIEEIKDALAEQGVTLEKWASPSPSEEK